MTVKKFEITYKKNKKTIMGWIEKNYLPGTTYNEETKQYDIPEGTWLPYTESRAKNAQSIYKSIVRASEKRKYVCADLFGISENEFNAYVKQLIDADLIEALKFADSFHLIATYKDPKEKIAQLAAIAASAVVAIST